MKDKVFQIVSRIMGVPIEQISEYSAPDVVQEWDSLKHMSLLLSLEEEFDVRFADDELIEMMGVGQILAVLQKHAVGWLARPVTDDSAAGPVWERSSRATIGPGDDMTREAPWI